jgi:hypothetical protein
MKAAYVPLALSSCFGLGLLHNILKKHDFVKPAVLTSSGK